MSYSGTVSFINEAKTEAIVVQENVIANIPAQNQVIGIGDGVSNQFFGALVPSVQPSTATFYSNNTQRTVAISSTGVLSGASINGAGLNYINLTTGACAICFAGIPGAVSSLTGTVNLAGNIDLSGNIYVMTVVVNGKTYLDLNFGDNAFTQLIDIVNIINKAAGTDVASIYTSTGSYLKIAGTIAGTGLNVVCTGSAATKFGVTGTSTTSTNPTSAIPFNNTVVTVNYQHTSADNSSSVFTFVNGDLSSVSIGDVISYDYTYTTDPNANNNSVVIA